MPAGAALVKVVPGDAEQESAGHGEGAEDGVRERHQRGVVGEDGPGVGHRGAAVDDFGADRVLHPGVGDEDEVGGEDRGQRGAPNGGEVDSLGQAAPAEDPQTEECRFDEEGEQRLHRQRGTEDVTDEAAVFAPCHAELEFLDDARRNAHDEVDEEQLSPELGHAQVFVLARAMPRRLHHGDHQPQAYGQGDHQEVINGGDAKLPSGDFKGIHGQPLNTHLLGRSESTLCFLRIVEVRSTHCRTFSRHTVNWSW